MPVTAKLSRKFYEALGDEVANELVNWFNAVDDTYRSDLKEVNELNYARWKSDFELRSLEFERGIDRRLNELDSRWEKRISELESRWEKRINELESRWEKRINELESRWEKRINELESRWEKRINELEAKWDGRFGQLELKIAETRAELIKWMFAFWAPTAVAIISLAIATFMKR